MTHHPTQHLHADTGHARMSFEVAHSHHGSTSMTACTSSPCFSLLSCALQVEFKKWCPAFKLLTYYGSAKERKAKRQGWSKPNAFHIAITSYTLILQVRARPASAGGLACCSYTRHGAACRPLAPCHCDMVLPL